MIIWSNNHHQIMITWFADAVRPSGSDTDGRRRRLRLRAGVSCVSCGHCKVARRPGPAAASDDSDCPAVPQAHVQSCSVPGPASAPVHQIPRRVDARSVQRRVVDNNDAWPLQQLKGCNMMPSPRCINQMINHIINQVINPTINQTIIN